MIVERSWSSLVRGLQLSDLSKKNLLKSRGEFTTCPSSLITGKPQKSAHGPLTHARPIRVELTITPSGPSGMHWRQISPPTSRHFAPSHHLCSLEPFSWSPSRRQTRQPDMLPQWSSGGGTFMSIMTFSHSVVVDPRRNNRQLPQSHVHRLLATCAELYNVT
ncbi:hypothetical protein TNCV_3741201 [Trichonephila clavipes]|nr:hypothetical protein TNCV_3741201 [Trichonephila clavipes]